MIRTGAQYRESLKDGREINQGMFIGQMLSDRETGTHLVLSNLRPLEEALERTREFQKKGVIQLKTVRVEARGQTGYLYFSQPRTRTRLPW